jgi:3-dehydroquinate dehydratase-2
LTLMSDKIMLLHGPNLNFLGKRDPKHYGSISLQTLENLVTNEAAKRHIGVICYQSNHEGYLIDYIQENADACLGIIINPGAFTHYSYALHDALLDSGLPIVEVHLSDIYQREAWRSHSVIAPACIAVISGKKENGYLEAVENLLRYCSC